MNKKRLKKTGTLISTIFFIMIAWFLILVWRESPTESAFNTEEVCRLNATWRTENESVPGEELPAFFSCDENSRTVVSTTIPESIWEYGNTLCFRASQEAVRIWIDSELLLEQGFLDSGNNVLGGEPSSSWVMFRLPTDSAGKEIRIELYSPYEDYKGHLNPVYVGTRSALLYFIIRSTGWRFLMAVLLLIIGVVMIVICVLYTQKRVFSVQILMPGIFGILTGVWMLGESQMLQFFTGKLVWWYNLTLISLHLIPLPLLKIIEEMSDFSYKKICRGWEYFTMFYLGILILMQILGIRDFMESLDISLHIMLFMCVTMVFLIYWDYLHNRNKKIFSMVVALTVLSAFCCVELITDLINLKVHLGTFLCMGVLAFYFIVAFHSMRHAMMLYSQGLRSLYYRNRSYVDQMTNCMNRRSFMEREKNWTPGGDDVLMMADLNYLKRINDNLGHHAGDEYILNCAEALQEVLGAWGTCYRMGGDEFLFWGKGLSEMEMKVMEAELQSLVRQRCREISPLCSVAAGYARAVPGDTTVADIMKRADQNMYENKRRLKEELADTDSFNERSDEKNEN